MTSRIIKSYGGSKALIDALSSLIVLETLKPSSKIYLISPWISDSPIIDHTVRQFHDIFPFCEGRDIKLSDFLKTCAWRGSDIRIIFKNDGKTSKDFYDMMKEYVKFRVSKDDHEKDLITSNIYLHGSMNFTLSGIHFNGEKVRISTDQSEINQAFLTAEAMWEEALEI